MRLFCKYHQEENCWWICFIVVDVQILFVQTISISFFTQIQLQFHCLISFKKIKILGRLIGIVAVVDLRLMT